MGHIASTVGNDATTVLEPCVATALIVAADTTTVVLLKQALQSVAISADTCERVQNCSKHVSCRRYEVSFIDFSLGAGTSSAIDAIRSGPSTRTTIIVAITANREQSNQAFASGVHFVIQQPISRSSVDGIIRAAFGLIVRERRRYFRCPIDVSVLGYRRTEGAWLGRTINISEGGLCIAAPILLIAGELLELEFKLPASSVEINVECDVQWSGEKGRAGLRFVSIHTDSKSDLQHWLAGQLDALLKPTLARVAPRTGGFLQSVMMLMRR